MTKKSKSKGKGKAKPYNGNIATVKSDMQQIIAGKVEPTILIQHKQLNNK